MNSDFRLILMTLVVLTLSCANAAASPGGDIDLDSHESTTPTSKTEEQVELELNSDLISIDQTPLKKPKTNPLKFLYPYKRSITARTGIMFDNEELEEGKYPLLIGAAYMLYKPQQPRYELLANINTNSEAQIGITRRHIMNEPNHYRGFWSYGTSLIIDPEEKFATITNIDNYTVTASFGMEDVSVMPKSVRLEVQLLVGTDTQAAIFYVGSSWGLLKGN